ncbi:hypothetical protein AAMO2058_001184300 [Amorphochlora amoebiformis]
MAGGSDDDISPMSEDLTLGSEETDDRKKKTPRARAKRKPKSTTKRKKKKKKRSKFDLHSSDFEVTNPSDWETTVTDPKLKAKPKAKGKPKPRGRPTRAPSQPLYSSSPSPPLSIEYSRPISTTRVSQTRPEPERPPTPPATQPPTPPPTPATNAQVVTAIPIAGERKSNPLASLYAYIDRAVDSARIQPHEPKPKPKPPTAPPTLPPTISPTVEPTNFPTFRPTTLLPSFSPTTRKYVGEVEDEMIVEGVAEKLVKWVHDADRHTESPKKSSESMDIDVDGQLSEYRCSACSSIFWARGQPPVVPCVLCDSPAASPLAIQGHLRLQHLAPPPPRKPTPEARAEASPPPVPENSPVNLALEWEGEGLRVTPGLTPYGGLTPPPEVHPTPETVPTRLTPPLAGRPTPESVGPQLTPPLVTRRTPDSAVPQLTPPVARPPTPESIIPQLTPPLAGRPTPESVVPQLTPPLAGRPTPESVGPQVGVQLTPPLAGRPTPESIVPQLTSPPPRHIESAGPEVVTDIGRVARRREALREAENAAEALHELEARIQERVAKAAREAAEIAARRAAEEANSRMRAQLVRENEERSERAQMASFDPAIWINVKRAFSTSTSRSSTTRSTTPTNTNISPNPSPGIESDAAGTREIEAAERAMILRLATGLRDCILEEKNARKQLEELIKRSERVKKQLTTQQDQDIRRARIREAVSRVVSDTKTKKGPITRQDKETLIQRLAQIHVAAREIEQGRSPLEELQKDIEAAQSRLRRTGKRRLLLTRLLHLKASIVARRRAPPSPPLTPSPVPAKSPPNNISSPLLPAATPAPPNTPQRFKTPDFSAGRRKGHGGGWGVRMRKMVLIDRCDGIGGGRESKSSPASGSRSSEVVAMTIEPPPSMRGSPRLFTADVRRSPKLEASVSEVSPTLSPSPFPTPNPTFIPTSAPTAFRSTSTSGGQEPHATPVGDYIKGIGVNGNGIPGVNTKGSREIAQPEASPYTHSVTPPDWLEKWLAPKPPPSNPPPNSGNWASLRGPLSWPASAFKQNPTAFVPPRPFGYYGAERATWTGDTGGVGEGWGWGLGLGSDVVSEDLEGEEEARDLLRERRGYGKIGQHYTTPAQPHAVLR